MPTYKDWELYEVLPAGWKIDKHCGSPLFGYDFCTALDRQVDLLFEDCSREIQHLHQRSRSRHVLQRRRDGRQRAIEIRRNAEVELPGVVPVGFFIKRREGRPWASLMSLMPSSPLAELHS